MSIKSNKKIVYFSRRIIDADSVTSNLFSKL